MGSVGGISFVKRIVIIMRASSVRLTENTWVDYNTSSHAMVMYDV